MEKIIRFFSESRKGDSIQTREILIKNYPPITIMLLIIVFVLIVIFKHEIVEGVKNLLESTRQ